MDRAAQVYGAGKETRNRGVSGGIDRDSVAEFTEHVVGATSNGSGPDMLAAGVETRHKRIGAIFVRQGATAEVYGSRDEPRDGCAA